MSDILKIGDVLTLEIEEINNLGAGVAHLDGLVVFVRGAVTGDTVRAKVIKVAKSFLVARLEEVLSPYENRIWWLYVSGQTAAQIAKAIGREERSVQNAIYRIRKKLRLALPHQ